MLTFVLALVLGLLAALGIAVSVSFRAFYLRDAENRLLREMEDINEIAVERYPDVDKRPAAREELFVIARRYDAYIQLYFDDEELGRRSLFAEDSGARWANAEDAELDDYVAQVKSGDYQEIQYGLLSKYTGFDTLTVMRPILTEAGESLGVLFFHEMGIVRRDDFYPIFLCQLNQYGIDLFLPLVGRLVTAWFQCFVTLKLDVIVVAEYALEPLHRLFRFIHLA